MYVPMTSLALIAGAALGQWSGHRSAENGFVADCAQQGLFVVYDADSDAHRHFHCFEVKDLQEFKEPAPPAKLEFEV
jgi:Fe2+ or Zn2+ uptake regulation protein